MSKSKKTTTAKTAKKATKGTTSKETKKRPTRVTQEQVEKWDFLSPILRLLGHPQQLSTAVMYTWIAFYNYVRIHGRPKGVIAWATPGLWASRLHCSPGDFMMMKAAAMHNKGLKTDEGGHNLHIPQLMSLKNIKQSTVTMRRHRAKKRLEADGHQPFFGEKEGKVMRRLFYPPSTRRFPRALAPALVKAFDLLLMAGVEDPKALLENMISSYRPPQHPIDHMNDLVGRFIRKKIELTTFAGPPIEDTSAREPVTCPTDTS
ncbi:hypothetical protein LCGC14_1353490 [marine sediment metagenome]|uniref:Uncharacterized protein n=1 Tax=marine sediment metagenome TaxID=412755 RepID=A0A0F9KWB4_9ZZZZ